MQPNKIHIQDLIEDAGWLQEEMKLLKTIIDVIPYDDRPLEQESVLDVVAKIGYACDNYFKPLIHNAVNCNDDLDMTPSSHFDSHYSIEYHEGRSALELLDHIIETRSEVQGLLKSLQPKEFDRIMYLKEGEVTLEKLLRDMVMYDRKQLKKVAERVLTIDPERSAARKL